MAASKQLARLAGLGMRHTWNTFSGSTPEGTTDHAAADRDTDGEDVN